MGFQDQIRESITARIVAALQRGGLPPWRRPWACSPVSSPTNFLSKKRYSGINAILLRLAEWDRGFGIGYWGTFRQWNERECRVKKGERATQVVLYKPIVVSKTGEDGEVERKSFPLLKTFSVFQESERTPS